MKYYYVAPDKEIDAIFSRGLKTEGNNEIPVIAVNETFLMTKYIFDVYAHEILGVDVYCAFEIKKEGIDTALFESTIDHPFKMLFKNILQQEIPREFLEPFKTDQSYEGMGLINGVFPVENRDKFTDKYKQKILEYIEGIGE